MPTPKRSAAREARITGEIVVDACTESERAMGWYCYLEAELRFPFRVRSARQRAISPLRRGDEVIALGMAPQVECAHELFVRVRWNGRAVAVPLAQVKPHGVDARTRRAVEDWHYWVERGYCF